MSEIICSYTKDEETEQFYFLMERNVNFQQFNDFLQNSRIKDESHSIYCNNELIDSDIKFVNSVNSAIQNNTAMAFKFNKSSVPALPSEVEKNNDLTFGETIKAIMQKIDMNFEKSPARPKELIQSIPFPHIVVIRQYIKHVRQNPSELTSVIQQAAKFYSVDEENLHKEVQEIINYFKNKRNNQSNGSGSEWNSAIKNNNQRKNFCRGNVQKISKCPEVDASDNFLAQEVIVNQSSASLVNDINKQSERKTAYPRKLKCIARRGFNLRQGELLKEQCAMEDAHNHPQVTSCQLASAMEHKVKYHPAICDQCNGQIAGIRYYCLQCRNYDLCSNCEEKDESEKFHSREHIFAKIKDTNTPY